MQHHFFRLPGMLQRAFTFECVAATPYTSATMLTPALFSLYIMAVLVQFPHTRLYRVALLCVVLWLTLRASMSLDFSWNDSEFDFLNQAPALGTFTLSMRAVAWAFAHPHYTRLPICRSGNETMNDHDEKTPPNHNVSIFSAMWNACDLVSNSREIGWNGPPKMPIPTPYFLVESRLIFFLHSILRTAFLTIVFDVLRRLISLFGLDTFGSPKGGTIFDPSLPPLERYMISSTVTLLCGLTAYVTVEGVYQLHAALFTMLFQQYPSQWPPLFDAPWMSTSLASFWGRRWHQLFRSWFLTVGGRPFQRYFGRAGTILGAFTLSGVLHDFGVRGIGRGSESLVVVGFFVMQGVGVIMEYAWKWATGRRVGGILGWLWTFSWLILWGNMIVDAWGRRGVLGGAYWPEAYRPTTLFMKWVS